jgi:hypothetical protein
MGILGEVPGGAEDLERARGAGLTPPLKDDYPTPELTPEQQGMAAEGQAAMGTRIGRDRPLAQTVNTMLREKDANYNVRKDVGLHSGALSTLHGLSQLTEDMPASKIHRQLTGQTLEEQQSRTTQGIRDARALGKAASMDEGNVNWLPDAGTTGRMLSDAVTYALPLAKAEKAATKVGGMLGLGLPSAKIAGAGITGGMEAATQPVLPGESRAMNVGVGAAIPAGISATAQAGRRATTGMFNTSDAAARLETDTNITPTLGQAIEGGVPAKLISNVEDYADNLIPGVSTGRKRARQELFDTIGIDAALGDLTDIPNGERVGSPEYFNIVRDQFNQAYDRILKNVDIDSATIVAAVNDALDAAGTSVDDKLRKRLSAALLEGVDPAVTPMLTGNELKVIMSASSDGIDKAIMGGNPGVNSSAIAMYNAVRKNLNDILEPLISPEGVRKLRFIDEAYAHRQVLEETAANVFQSSPGVLTPEALAATIQSRSATGGLARQLGPSVALSADATTVLGQSRQSMWARAAAGTGVVPRGEGVIKEAGLVGAAVTLGPLVWAGSGPRGSKALRGQYGAQQAIAKVMREIVEPKIGTATVLLTNNED